MNACANDVTLFREESSPAGEPGSSRVRHDSQEVRVANSPCRVMHMCIYITAVGRADLYLDHFAVRSLQDDHDDTGSDLRAADADIVVGLHCGVV